MRGRRLGRVMGGIRVLFFFFQAEDGIRDYKVTGVQTCALPICFICDLETPRMATSGAFTMGVKAVPPIPPRLEMLKQPPCISSALSLPSRALAASSPSSL